MGDRNRRLTRADVTVDRRPVTGAVTVSAAVPGPEGFDYLASVQFYGYSKKEARRLFINQVNGDLAKRGVTNIG
jgi:hypothetical protein